MGAWIEILLDKLSIDNVSKSHPVWVRGLKYENGQPSQPIFGVAPRVGAWIEIRIRYGRLYQSDVAPRVGAWIEISIIAFCRNVKSCRTPCGCVD